MEAVLGSALKILAIHRFYWPDTPPYASMLRAIVRRLVQDGHEVDVLSSQPSYKDSVINHRQEPVESLDGATVRRLRLPSEAGRSFIRVVNAVRLGLSIFWHAVIRKKYDVIMVSTYPPVLAGWFSALASRLSGARFIYHCMDIHPEIGRISGEFSNRRLFSLLSILDHWTCSQADPVIVLSEDMSKSLSGRKVGSALNIKVVNNFSLPSNSSSDLGLPFAWPDASFVILFAGNVGRFQGLNVLIEAMAKLKHHDDIYLIMMGEGTEREGLQNMAESYGANVMFVGHHSIDIAKIAMKKASIGFVGLAPNLYKYAYPSKTMTLLEQGCPLIVAAEPRSCLVNDIVAYGVGISVDSGDAQGLVEAISYLSENPDELECMRKRAIDYGYEAFSQEAKLDEWSAIFQN